MSADQPTASATHVSASTTGTSKSIPVGKLTPIEAFFEPSDRMLSLLIHDARGVRFVCQFSLDECERRLMPLVRGPLS